MLLLIKHFSFAALIFGVVLFLQNINLAQTTNSQPKRKPSIMIVGSYHMGNPGRDVANLQAEDVLQPKHQREIEEVVSLLKKFNPTKIAVEIEPTKDSQLQNNYQKYLSGDYQLKRNEIDQIGFRLAKDLKHQQIYAVNWMGDPPGAEADYDYEAFARRNNQNELLENFKRKAQASIKPMEDIQRKGTILDLYRYLNDEEAIRKSHQNYYRYLDFAAGDQYIGANWLQYWYGRNLKIFTNLMRITESPNDRILVVYGAGHLKWLKEFARESGSYQVEDASKYLNSNVASKK